MRWQGMLREVEMEWKRSARAEPLRLSGEGCGIVHPTFVPGKTAAMLGIALSVLLVSGCPEKFLYPKITIGEEYSGTITGDSVHYYNEGYYYNNQYYSGFECYLNHHMITVEAGHTYTVSLWADNDGARFEDPDVHGSFLTGNVTSSSSFPCNGNATRTSAWTIYDGGSFRVNVYVSSIPTRYRFTVRY
jgi:hypothetical protein